MHSYNINDFKSLLTECRQRILNTHEVSTHDKGTADLITEFAALYVPSTDTLYHSILGNGAFKNGVPLKSYPDFPIAKSLVSFGDFSKSAPASRPYQMKLIGTLKEEAMKIRLFGSSCIDFTALAAICGAHNPAMLYRVKEILSSVC